MGRVAVGSRTGGLIPRRPAISFARARETINRPAMPEFYDRFLVPLQFGQFAEDLAERLRTMTSGQLLEIAAGTGIVTRALTGTLSKSVDITATDRDLAGARLLGDAPLLQASDGRNRRRCIGVGHVSFLLLVSITRFPERHQHAVGGLLGCHGAIFAASSASPVRRAHDAP